MHIKYSAKLSVQATVVLFVIIGITFVVKLNFFYLFVTKELFVSFFDLPNFLLKGLLQFYSSFFSILGRIIRITDEVIEYRKWIQETFPVESTELHDYKEYPTALHSPSYLPHPHIEDNLNIV